MAVTKDLKMKKAIQINDKLENNTNGFNKVIGYESIVNELKQICDVLKNRDVYEKLGVSIPRGIMLHGDPGLGKTLMAKSFVEEAGWETFTCRKDKPNGDFVKAIKETFDNAVNASPSIVFLDDMDKFATGRSRGDEDAEEYVAVQSCIDEARDKDVFVIATANDIDDMPDSLLRAGRFDRVIYVSEPSVKDTEKLAEYYIKQKTFEDDIDIASIAHIMGRAPVAEIETVINYAGLYAGFERAEIITTEHLMKACLHVLHGVSEDSFTKINKGELSLLDGKIKAIIYHEAGHAALCEILDPGSVSLCTTYGSGRNGRGPDGLTSYCHSSKWEDTSTEMDEVMLALAGMAATDHKLGSPDTGCSEDVSKAVRIIKHAVEYNCRYGFGLSHIGAPWEENSQDLNRMQETVVSAKLEEGLRKAKEILVMNNDFYEAVAEALAEKCILTQKDIKTIREQFSIVSPAA